jgi:hypothetical protein
MKFAEFQRFASAYCRPGSSVWLVKAGGAFGV